MPEVFPSTPSRRSVISQRRFDKPAVPGKHMVTDKKREAGVAGLSRLIPAFCHAPMTPMLATSPH
jgi:hypothetical protein